MTEHVLSRASGIDSMLCQSNCREAEAGLQTRVAGIEIQLNEVNDLADKRDRRPTARGSFSTVNTSAIYLYQGARNRDITGGRVISAKTVDRRGVCGNRAGEMRSVPAKTWFGRQHPTLVHMAAKAHFWIQDGVTQARMTPGHALGHAKKTFFLKKDDS